MKVRLFSITLLTLTLLVGVHPLLAQESGGSNYGWYQSDSCIKILTA